jgi:hypothetical protein
MVLPFFCNAAGEFFDQKENFINEEFNELPVFKSKDDSVVSMPAVVASN